MTDYASLCVLSFNRLSLIAPSLRTLIERAEHPYELIVHDDGSDPTVTAYLKNMLDEKLISTLILNTPGHNQGQGVALNRMFSMSTGDPIIKLDHDLEYQPGWLRHVDLLLDSNRELYDGGGDALIGLLGLLHYWHEPVHSDATRLAAHGPGWHAHTHILGSAFALRREAWELLGPFDEHAPSFAEDADMQRRVTESDGFVCALPYDANGRPMDLVKNHGMGYGPSTVNVSPGVVQSINERPFVHGA